MQSSKENVNSGEDQERTEELSEVKVGKLDNTTKSNLQ